jgi:thioredoxin 1
MNRPVDPAPSPPWLLFIGLLLGGGFLVFMAWDSIAGAFKKDTERGSVNVVHLSNANWQKEVIESKIPVVVDFWAPWCGPCRQLTPTIDKMADKFAGRVKVGKLNLDDEGAQEIAAKYSVTTIPRVFIFNGSDKPVWSESGVVSENELANAIDSVLKTK